ncbi:unnamed protein product [Cuscuta campestris]|uniref:Uncharacterized protein n=1 Tax=Cuscuta campestris TaxID=132261 RepID=A0A484MS47_9ASTE|nr:unnamed protein product [Cuscuta campestris]
MSCYNKKYCEVMVTKFAKDREKWPVFDKDVWVQASGGVQKGDQWTGVPLEFSNPDAFTSATMTSRLCRPKGDGTRAELHASYRRGVRGNDLTQTTMMVAFERGHNEV